MSKQAEGKVPELRFPGFEGEQLHSSYKKYRFEDIFLFSTGKNIKQSEAAPEFEIPCVRYGELYHMYNEVIVEVFNRTNLNRDELLFSKGDEILLPSAGEDPMDIGSASALPFSGIAIGRTINILRPKIESFYSQIYVSYYINQKLKEKIATLAKGVSISNVYNSDLKKLEITLPTLPEQQKIATFLTAVDTKLQQLTRKKALLEQYKKGVIQQLFSQQLRFKGENGEEFPAWEEKTLGEIGDYFNGLTGKTKDDFGLGKPYITYKQIFANSKIDTSKFEYVQINDNDRQNKVKYGDIFFTTSSETPNEVGFASVLLDNVEELYLNSFCFGFRPKSFDILHPDFARFLFRSELFRTEVIKLAQGSTRYNMSKTQLMKITVNLPSLPEQQKIAAYLTALDGRIGRVGGQLAGLRAWKKGLLQGMFV